MRNRTICDPSALDRLGEIVRTAISEPKETIVFAIAFALLIFATCRLP